MADTTTKTKITEVAAVMVPVTEPDQAIAFYTENLGCELRSDTPFGEGLRWVEVGYPGAPTAIALVPPREGDPTGIDTHLSLNTTDIDADHADLKAKGVDIDDEVSRMGDPVPPLCWLRDQDGNTLMLVQRSDS
jgi:catechol 2,3-dioxygenase-like lactoylglutathione lyase family enzyme